MEDKRKELYFYEGILQCELRDGTGVRIAVVENLHDAVQWFYNENSKLPKKSSFWDGYRMKVKPEQLKALVEERWWEDFKQFTKDGTSSDEFKRHLDECDNCGKAVDLVQASQSINFSLIGKEIGYW